MQPLAFSPCACVKSVCPSRRLKHGNPTEFAGERWLCGASCVRSSPPKHPWNLHCWRGTLWGSLGHSVCRGVFQLCRTETSCLHITGGAAPGQKADGSFRPPGLPQETRRRKRPITWLRAVACAPVAAGGRKSSCRQTWQSTLGPATQRRTTGRKLAEVGEARTTSQFSRAQRRQRQRLALPCLCSLAYLRSCSSTAIARHHHLSRGTATHARTLQLVIALAFLAVSILGRAAAPAARARPPWGLLIPQVARVVGRPRGRNAVETQLRTVPERRRHAGPPRLGPRLWPPVHRRRVPRHHRALPPLGPPEHCLAFDTEQQPVHVPRPYAQPPSPPSPPRLLLRSAFPLTSPSCRRPLTYASGANAIRHPGLDSRNPSPS